MDPQKEYLSGVVNHACVCLALSGLSVMLFINQQEYIGVLSQSAGIRFLVHRRDHFPFLEEEGQNAGPGTLSAVKLTLVSLYESLHCLYPCSTELLAISFTCRKQGLFLLVAYGRLLCHSLMNLICVCRLSGQCLICT